ncbi:MAG: amidohydrolase family protein [Burkholderiaceae bacterium]
MQIIDAHHHFWNLSANRHPWLVDDEPIAFRYGDYAAIAHDFLPADLRRLAAQAGLSLIGSVAMEGETDPSEPVREAHWMDALAREHGLPDAHAAQIWLDRDDLAQVLAETESIALVRSVRHKPRACPTPAAAAANAALPGSMRCPRWRAGYELLARSRLHFELQTPWWHLPDAVPLAERHPGTLIIVNHTGLPADRSHEGLLAWECAMRRLAVLPNVRIKISGLGVRNPDGRSARWPVTQNIEIVRRTIEIFGPHRIMFASNFPVDSLAADYATIWSTFEQATRDFDRAERHAMFVGTANACYQLGIAPGC